MIRVCKSEFSNVQHQKRYVVLLELPLQTVLDDPRVALRVIVIVASSS